jgi:ABC-type transport system involved in cytochrome bd biosynthesis fused ATPase/permease subunit
LGFVVAIIENEAEYQEKMKNRFLRYYFSANVATVIGIVVMGILSTFNYVNLSLAILGVLILVTEIIFTVRKLILQKRKVA